MKLILQVFEIGNSFACLCLNRSFKFFVKIKGFLNNVELLKINSFDLFSNSKLPFLVFSQSLKCYKRVPETTVVFSTKNGNRSNPENQDSYEVYLKLKKLNSLKSYLFQSYNWTTAVQLQPDPIELEHPLRYSTRRFFGKTANFFEFIMYYYMDKREQHWSENVPCALVEWFQEESGQKSKKPLIGDFNQFKRDLRKYNQDFYIVHLYIDDIENKQHVIKGEEIKIFYYKQEQIIYDLERAVIKVAGRDVVEEYKKIKNDCASFLSTSKTIVSDVHPAAGEYTHNSILDFLSQNLSKGDQKFYQDRCKAIFNNERRHCVNLF